VKWWAFALAASLLLFVGCWDPTPKGAEPIEPCALEIPTEAEHSLRLEPLVRGLSSPLYLTHAGDDSKRLFIVEQPGTIRILQDGLLLEVPFLDIRDRVSFGGERGLLSVAFHPDYVENGRFFVNYTRRGDGATVIAEYRVGDEPNVANTQSERVILVVEQPFANHNGGQLQFGPDGMLYVGMGDGGAAGDPLGHGQNRATLLGALLRLDVDGEEPYAIPSDNPFVGIAGVREEIWAYGLRNPWRFSFDRCDGRLFLADVGQDGFEEINLIAPGANYGWNIMEGAHCFDPPTGCDQRGLELPIAEYDHSLGCSITGGYVYRGRRYPELVGRYLFGDFCSGRIWSLSPTEAGAWVSVELLKTDLSISSFGEDEEGELYVLDLGGEIYRIVGSGE